MTTTANRKITKLPTTAVDYNASGPWATVVDALIDLLDAALGVEIHTTAEAIGIKEGTVLIGGSGVSALTLVAPTAGLPSAGTPGDDGKQLRIMAVTAHAHTVTTPSSAVDGAHHIITFAAAGDTIDLTAYNGVWYPGFKTASNVVIS